MLSCVTLCQEKKPDTSSRMRNEEVCQKDLRTVTMLPRVAIAAEHLSFRSSGRKTAGVD